MRRIVGFMGLKICGGCRIYGDLPLYRLHLGGEIPGKSSLEYSRTGLMLITYAFH